METKLAFSMGLLSDHSSCSHPESLIRRILEDNTTTLVEAITAGSLTVAIASNGHGIRMMDATSGIVRFVLGGRDDLFEEAHFFVDWGNRTLELQVIQGG